MLRKRGGSRRHRAAKNASNLANRIMKSMTVAAPSATATANVGTLQRGYCWCAKVAGSGDVVEAALRERPWCAWRLSVGTAQRFLLPLEGRKQADN